MTRLTLCVVACLALAMPAAAQLTPVGPSVNLPPAGCYQINNDSFVCRSVAGTFTIGTTKNGTDGVLSLGTVLAGNGTPGAPSLSFASEPTTGWFRFTPSSMDLSVAGTRYFAFQPAIEYVLSNSAALIFGTSNDTSLSRASAGVFATSPLTTTGGDVTLINGGTLVTQRYQATITPATGGATNCGPAFLAAALTADCTIATLAAGEKLIDFKVDVTAGFTCSGTCVGTKTIAVGKTAGGAEVLAAGASVVTTATQFGLVDTDFGTSMTRAAQVAHGYIPSWTATTPLIVRFTSGTGNWGSGVATFVNAGSVTFTLLVEQIK